MRRTQPNQAVFLHRFLVVFDRTTKDLKATPNFLQVLSSQFSVLRFQISDFRFQVSSLKPRVTFAPLNRLNHAKISFNSPRPNYDNRHVFFTRSLFGDSINVFFASRLRMLAILATISVHTLSSNADEVAEAVPTATASEGSLKQLALPWSSDPKIVLSTYLLSLARETRSAARYRSGRFAYQDCLRRSQCSAG